MRERYIQDPVTHELIPAAEYFGPSQSTASYIMPDIKPYQSMITGDMITSRSQHREHLKQHNCFEIGNEIDHVMKTSSPLYNPDREGIRRRLAEVMNGKGYK